MKIRHTNFTEEELEWLERKTCENDMYYFWDTLKLGIERGSLWRLLTTGETKSLKRSGVLKRGTNGKGRMWFTEDFAKSEYGRKLGLV